MVIRTSVSRKIFVVANYIFLTSFGAICLIPFLNLLAISFSEKIPVAAGNVFIWPVGMNLASYSQLTKNNSFIASAIVSLQRVALGVSINFLLTVHTAYPLSKEPSAFKFRTGYAWIFVVTMLVNGGLIPWYLTVRSAGLLNTIWALVIPGAVPVFSVVLVLNFFRGLPKEIEEAALIDGARHFTVLWRIYVPMSVSALATITLFSFVGHWNSWFDGMILINTSSKMPLQSFLQLAIIQFGQGVGQEILRNVTPEMMRKASDQTIKAAFVCMSMAPILLLFPFFQSFLKTGIVLGSVKQ